MRARQTAVSRLPLHWIFQAGSILFWAGLITRTTFSGASPVLMALGGIVLAGSFLLTSYWLLHPRISLRYRHDAGFFRRNRDALVLLMCGAVVGGVVQYLASLFTVK